jgi:hypothetical protein
VRGDKDWLELEQPFVDRAEFFDVEGGVIDADGLAVVGMLVEAERAQAAEQHVVAELAVAS